MPAIEDVAEVIRWVQTVEWTLLALAAVNHWRRHRTPSTTWLAFTFGSLAVVVLAGLLVPVDQTQLTTPIRLLVVVLALFPYLLYRFVVSMLERTPWAWVGAHLLTAAAILTTLSLSSVPRPGQPRSLAFLVFVSAFVAQWAFLLAYTAVRLWRAGAGQPVVARKRMRTMAIAASILAMIIVASAGSTPEAGTHLFDVIVSASGLVAAPLFFLGFDPPRLLRIVWRQREEGQLRDAEIGLVRAISRPDVAAAWLPRVSALIGGQSAVLFDMDRSVLATHNFTPREIDDARLTLPPADMKRYQPIDVGPYRVLTMHNGWLALRVDPLTPFFGDDELRMLGASSVVADLALGRARLFELERQARDAMRDFVAIASHDLRTPVTVIAGFTDLMQMQWDAVADDDKQTYIRAISRQVVHLHRLIDDLLTVSKLDVRELDVIPEVVDLDHAIREVIDELGIEATIEDVASPSQTRAMVDPDHVSRMIRNYLSNASTYGAPPVRVEIGVESGWAVVRVRDCGPGVTDDFVPKLFQRFARADKKKSKAVQGTGLGLSIVRGLARSNGGDAWYEHNVPTGACFGFRLPVAAIPAQTVRT